MGLLEKLETAVKNHDKKTFIDTIYDFTTEDILSLTDDELNSIFKISEQIEIKEVDEFYDDLEEQGLFSLENAMNGLDEINNALIGRFYFGLCVSLYQKYDEEFASALMHKGVACCLLSNLGIKELQNLEVAVELYQKAQNLFAPYSADYALVLMNEGIARQRLAERGIDTQKNLEAAVELYQRAQKLFVLGSTDYASALMNEGVARRKLAERDIDTQKNLEAAVELYQKAQELFSKDSTYYASALMNEGTALETLAERGIDAQKNLVAARELYIHSISILEKSKDGGIYSIALLNLNRFFINNFHKSGNRSYLEEAKKILEDAELKIKDREVWDKELILSKLHEIRASLLEFEGKSGINRASREYNEAYRLTGNSYYKFMDEFSLARIDIDENSYCKVVEEWKEIEKAGIFLDYYDYSIFECHLGKAVVSKGLSREEEFTSAMKKLEEIRDRTQIRIIKDRVSAYVYIMNALVECFRKDKYDEAKINIKSACKIFHEYDDKDGKKTCDIFFDAINHNKDPEAWIEIIRQKDKLSCNIYRLLSEGADRKRADVGNKMLQEIYERTAKIDDIHSELNAGFERIKDRIEQGFKEESEQRQALINRLDEIRQKLDELIDISNKVDEKEGESIRQFSKKIQQMLEKGDSDGLKRFVEFIINSEGSFLSTIEQANISENDKEEAKEKLKGSLSGFKGIQDKVKKEAGMFGRHVTYHIAAALMAEGIIKHIFPLISTAVIGIPIPSQVLDAVTKISEKKQYPPLQPM